MNAILALLKARYKSLWRMLWRPQGRAGNLFGLFIGLIILGGIFLGTTATAFVLSSREGIDAALVVATLVIAGFQLLTLLGAGFSGRFGIFNDPRPLQPYPLKSWQWALATVAGQALDMGTLYPLAATLGLSLGLAGGGPSGLAAAPALLVGHLILAAETVGLSGVIARFAASRKFRDTRQLFGILVSLGFSAAYLLFFFPRARPGYFPGGRQIMAGASLASPSGALLSALAGALEPDSVKLAAGLAAALAHLALAAGLVYAAIKLAAREPGAPGEKIGRARLTGWLTRPLPAGMGALLRKDLAYLRREPGLAGRLVGNFLQTAMLVLFIAFSPAAFRAAGTGFYFFLSALSALGAGRMLLYNQWGYEGPGVSFLLAGRFRAWELLGAKWLLGLIVVGLDALLMAVVLRFFLGGTPSQWLLYWLLVALAPLGAAIGGYLSQRYPFPMLGRGRLRNLNRPYEWAMMPIMMGARAVFLAAAAPVIAIYGLVSFLGDGWVAANGAWLIPAALLFSAGYALTLSVAALPWLAKRLDDNRPELLERLVIPEENL